AVDRPYRLVRQSLCRAPTLPCRIAQPSRQTRTGDSNPDRAFAIGKQCRDIVAGKTRRPADEAPLALPPLADSRFRGCQHATIRCDRQSRVADEGGKRGLTEGQRWQLFETSSLAAADVDEVVAEKPKIPVGAVADRRPGGRRQTCVHRHEHAVAHGAELLAAPRPDHSLPVAGHTEDARVAAGGEEGSGAGGGAYCQSTIGGQ